jgi:aerobic-type carbon monoxide dehydrogenase small subunit (CoxS/CutS family)
LEIEFQLDGRPERCPEGVTAAAALFHVGRRASRITARRRAPRALFCGMGACFECAMVIDGRAGVRSCVTLVRPGMRIETQRGASSIEDPR